MLTLLDVAQLSSDDWLQLGQSRKSDREYKYLTLKDAFLQS